MLPRAKLHPRPGRLSRQRLQYFQAVHTREHQIHYHHVGLLFPRQTDGLLPVPRLADQYNIVLLCQRSCKKMTELLAGIGQ